MDMKEKEIKVKFLQIFVWIREMLRDHLVDADPGNAMNKLQYLASHTVNGNPNLYRVPGRTVNQCRKWNKNIV